MFEQIGNGICLITSGPTSVPIDPVRSIENFSTGLRGARMAENFLAQKWNVIFLHRRGSARPFRHRIKIDMNLEKFEAVQHEWRRNKGRLLELEFEQLDEYFEKLEELARDLERTKTSRKMILLAAAVADFVCKSATSQKIDSSATFSAIQLDKVPKMIRPLTSQWAPSVDTFSFKLETDEQKIVQKAQKYFEQGVRGVVGNELTSRQGPKSAPRIFQLEKFFTNFFTIFFTNFFYVFFYEFFTNFRRLLFINCQQNWKVEIVWIHKESKFLTLCSEGTK